MGEEFILNPLYGRGGIWSLVLKKDTIAAVRHSWGEQLLFYLIESPELPKELCMESVEFGAAIDTIPLSRLRIYSISSVQKIVVRWSMGRNRIEIVSNIGAQKESYSIRFRGRTDKYEALLREMYDDLVVLEMKEDLRYH